MQHRFFTVTSVCLIGLFVGTLCVSFPVHSNDAGAPLSDHPSLMYQERYAYTLALFEAIARQSTGMVDSAVHHQAEDLVRSAKTLQQNNELDAALAKLNAVISLLQMQSPHRPQQLREESRYLSLLEGLPYFQSAHQRHFLEAQLKHGQEAHFGYSAVYVDSLIQEAKIYASEGRYGEAAVLLRSAQERIASAIKQLVNHTQIGVVEYVVSPTVVLGRSPQEIAKEKYQTTEIVINHFREAHKRQHSVESFDVVGYDAKLVDWLLSEAKALAEEQSYQAAYEVVDHVRNLITKALRDTLNGHDIVVELDISTPEKEFAYEHRRYQGYEELIPVALERMRPDEDTVKLMSYYVEQGRSMEKKALDTADSTDFPVAIRMVLDATRSIQMALRTLGVPIYDSR